MNEGDSNYWVFMLAGITLIVIGGFMMLKSNGLVGILIAFLGVLTCGKGAGQYKK